MGKRHHLGPQCFKAESPPTQKPWPDRVPSNAEALFLCLLFFQPWFGPWVRVEEREVSSWIILDSQQGSVSLRCSRSRSGLLKCHKPGGSLPRAVHTEGPWRSWPPDPYLKRPISYRRTVFSLGLLLTDQNILN